MSVYVVHDPCTSQQEVEGRASQGGYSVQRVNASVNQRLLCRCVSNDAGHRLNQGNQRSFVR